MVSDVNKKQYHHGNLREALIRAASELVAEAGLEGLSLRAVAEKIGVSRTAMYRHFESKDELLQTIVIDGFRQLIAATEPHLTANPEDTDNCPLRRLKEMGLSYSQFATSNPAIYETMFRKDLIDRDNPELIKTAEESFSVLIRMLQQCQASGAIQRGDLRKQAFTIWVSLHGTITLCKDGAPLVIPEATLAGGFMMVLETLMDGLTCEENWREQSSGWDNLGNLSEQDFQHD